ERVARRLGTIECPGRAVAVQAFGARALVSVGSAGVTILDLAGAPREIARLRLPRSLPAGRSAISGTLAFVAADLGGIAVLDLADPVEPQVLAPPARAMKVKM